MRRRRLVTGLALTGLTVVVAAAGASSEPAERWLAERVRGVIQGALAPGWTVGPIGLAWSWSGRVTLTGLALDDPRQVRVIEVARLDLGIVPDGWPWRRVRVRSARLDGVRVRVDSDTDGVLDLVRGFGGPWPVDPEAPPWGGLPVGVVVDDLRARDVLVSLGSRDAAGATHDAAVVKLLDLAASVQLPRNEPVVDVHDLAAHVVVVEPGGVAATLGGRVRWAGGALVLDGVSLTTHGTRVRADAKLDGLSGDSHVDASVHVEPLDLGTLDVLFDAGTAGAWTGSLAGRGTLAALDLTADLAEPGGGRVGLREGSRACVVPVESPIDPCGGPQPVAPDSPLRWRAVLDLDAVSVERIVPAIGGPLRLEGRVRARGGGTTWPDGVFVEDGRWEGEDLDVWGVPIRRLVGSVRLERGVLGLSELDVTAVAGVARGAGTFDLVGGRLDLDAEGELDLGMLADLDVTTLAGVGTFRGTVRGDTYADGAPIAVRATARLRGGRYAEDVRAAAIDARVGVDVRDGDVEVRAEGALTSFEVYGARLETARVPTLEVRVDDDGVIVRGSASGPVLTYGDSVRVSEPDASFDVVVPEVGPTRVVSRATVGEHDVYGLLGSHGQVDVDLVGDRLALGLDLRWADDPFLVTDGLTLDLGRREVRLEGLDFRPTARQAWTLERPLQLRWTDDGIADADVSLRSAFGRLDMQGTLGRTGRLDGVVRLESFDLEAVAEMLPDRVPGIDGVVDLEARLTGSARAPRVEATTTVQRLFLVDRLRYLDVSGSARVEDDRLTLDVGTAVGGAAWLHVDGVLPVRSDLGEPGLRTAEEADLRLQLLPGSLDRFADALPGVEAPAGEASAAVRLTGPLRDPRLDVDLLARLEVEGFRSPLRVEADVERRGDDVQARIDLFEGLRPLLVADGAARTRLGEIVDWLLGSGPEPDFSDLSLFASDVTSEARVLDVPVELLRRVAGVDVDVDGTVRGVVTARGDLRHPTVQAELVTDAVAAGTPTPLVVAIAPADDGYRLDAVLGDAADPWLRVEGHLPVRIDTSVAASAWGIGDFDLRASGRGVPLSVARAIDPNLEVVSGDLVVSGAITGALDAPRPDVEVELRDATLRYRPLGLLVRQAHGRVRTRRVGEDRVRVELVELTAETRPLSASLDRVASVGESQVAVDGWVELAGSRAVAADASVRLRNAWLTATPERLARVTGEVTARGAWPGLAVDGSLAVDQGRLALNTGDLLQDRSANLDPSLVVHRATSTDRSLVAEAADSVLSGVDLDLRVDLGRNTNLGLKVPVFEDLGSLGAQVTRADIEARLGGQLDVRSQAGELSIVGEVEALEGRVSVLRGKFDLGEGSRVTFLGRDYSNPVLDIRGAMPVAGGQVRLALGGTALSPTFDFTSDDFGSDAAILMILLTGEAPEELSANQGEAALKAMSDLLVSGLLGGVNLGGSVAIEADGTVRVGVPLARTVYLESQLKPTAGLQENTITVQGEWNLTPQLVLDARYGDRRVSGELAYELRFTTSCDRVRARWASVVGRAVADAASCRIVRRAVRQGLDRPESSSSGGVDAP